MLLHADCVTLGQYLSPSEPFPIGGGGGTLAEKEEPELYITKV